MKKFAQILAVAIVGTTGSLYAQSGIYAGDALRFSRTDYGSSARFKGLGNAQISLGGDISSVGGNPAGLGMFTRSEFSITPEFNNIQAKTEYLNQRSKSSKNPMNLNQAAAVWYNPVIKPRGADLNKGVLSFVWGIGYNRNNDFGLNNNYSGQGAGSSISKSWAESANAYGLTDGYIEKPAYNSYLLDKVAGNNGAYLPATSSEYQSVSEQRSGSTSEFNFSGAMNISNQLYLGASIGFVSTRYKNDFTFTESGTVINNASSAVVLAEANPHVGNNYDLVYGSSRETTGSGINGKLGLIYKPADAVRLGATFVTPTWMHVEVDKTEFLDAQFSTGNVVNETIQSDLLYSNFNYNLRTPYKGSFGASIILGENALLSADIDYVDYGTTRLSTSDGYANEIHANNDFIKANYGSAVNYRVGGEYKIDKFSLRAGYGLNGSPYKDDSDNKFDVKYYSGGIGYRVSQYYVDLAYQRTETTNTFAPYELNDFSEPIATSKVAKNNIFLTVGVRF